MIPFAQTQQYDPSIVCLARDCTDTAVHLETGLRTESHVVFLGPSKRFETPRMLSRNVPAYVIYLTI